MTRERQEQASRDAAHDGTRPTTIGLDVLHEYAVSVMHGHPDVHREQLYAGTPLEPYLLRIKSNRRVAEFWSR